MRKTAKPHRESDRHVLCPFCGADLDTESAVRWCSGCGAEWTKRDSGEVVFDSSRRADRQTVEEAVRAESGASRRGLEGAARRRPVRLGKKQK